MELYNSQAPPFLDNGLIFNQTKSRKSYLKIIALSASFFILGSLVTFIVSLCLYNVNLDEKYGEIISIMNQMERMHEEYNYILRSHKTFEIYKLIQVPINKMYLLNTRDTSLIHKMIFKPEMNQEIMLTLNSLKKDLTRKRTEFFFEDGLTFIAMPDVAYLTQGQNVLKEWDISHSLFEPDEPNGDFTSVKYVEILIYKTPKLTPTNLKDIPNSRNFFYQDTLPIINPKYYPDLSYEYQDMTYFPTPFGSNSKTGYSSHESIQLLSHKHSYDMAKDQVLNHTTNSINFEPSKPAAISETFDNFLNTSKDHETYGLDLNSTSPLDIDTTPLPILEKFELTEQPEISDLDSALTNNLNVFPMMKNEENVTSSEIFTATPFDSHTSLNLETPMFFNHDFEKMGVSNWFTDILTNDQSLPDIRILATKEETWQRKIDFFHRISNRFLAKAKKEGDPAVAIVKKGFSDMFADGLKILRAKE